MVVESLLLLDVAEVVMKLEGEVDRQGEGGAEEKGEGGGG